MKENFYIIFYVFMTFIEISLRGMFMFGLGVLKRGILESVRFCIGDLPMYRFLVPTHPRLKPKSIKRKSCSCFVTFTGN